MTGIITNLTSIVTASVSWITEYVEVITESGNELLLFMILFGFVGTGIGLLKRLMSVR